uniref:Myb/SANT-like DNA-binding domain-containing protein n=1 Tax=Leersia perrieri TaxID=77586 RepID=A0A0D9VSX5_9ORYZ
MSSSPSPPPPPPSQKRADGWWSDGETTALIEAWGPLYVARDRGHLPVGEWRAAASAAAVNAHRAAAGRRHNRTRAQCQSRVRTLKNRYKRELSNPTPSGWRHFSRLHAFLAGGPVLPDGPPPGFPPRPPMGSIKKEEAEEEEEKCHQEEAVGSGSGGGLLGSWITSVPRRPRNVGVAAACCPAEVVTKLAEVYERVELAWLEVEKKKIAMEREENVKCKNRMDYLKKRLKATDRYTSKGARPPPPPAPVSGSIDRLRALLDRTPSVSPGFTPRGGGAPKAGDDDDGDGDETFAAAAAPLPRSWPSVPKRPRTAVALLPVSSSSATAGHHHGGDGGTPCTEVAAALDRLAGTYERVEAAKQKEATRLEERRLEAMRDLEIERMRILVDVAISGSTVADADVATATAASSSW